jgi:predicted type IV restriction endonuclease
MKIPAKVLAQLTDNLKSTQVVIRKLRDADKNETDTVAVIRESLVTLFGYDRFEELVAELKIENLRCDLALKLDGQVWALVECKAVGVELKQNQIEQALHYAAKSGNHWVILTNAQRWQVWWVHLEGRISTELVMDVDLLAMSTKNERDLDQLYALSRQGMFSGMLGAVRAQKNALDRFWLGQVLQSEPILSSIRREISRLEQNKVTDEEIQRVLVADVLKRELIDDPRADAAKLRYKKALKTATAKDAARKALNAAKLAVDDQSESEESIE